MYCLGHIVVIFDLAFEFQLVYDCFMGILPAPQEKHNGIFGSAVHGADRTVTLGHIVFGVRM